jgi:hypothetical protein
LDANSSIEFESEIGTKAVFVPSAEHDETPKI